MIQYIIDSELLLIAFSILGVPFIFGIAYGFAIYCENKSNKFKNED